MMINQGIKDVLAGMQPRPNARVPWELDGGAGFPQDFTITNGTTQTKGLLRTRVIGGNSYAGCVTVSVGWLATPYIRIGGGGILPVTHVTKIVFNFGTGGSRQTLEIDMYQGIIVTLPCSEVDVSIRSQNTGIFPYRLQVCANATLAQHGGKSAHITSENPICGDSVYRYMAPFIPPFARRVKLLKNSNANDLTLIFRDEAGNQIFSYRVGIGDLCPWIELDDRVNEILCFDTDTMTALVPDTIIPFLFELEI